MTSITRAETLPPQTEATLRMTLLPREVPLGERVDTMLRLLCPCDLFSAATKAKVERWIKRFLDEFAPHLGSKEGAKKASLVLCYLITSIIRPEIGALQGHLAEQKELLKRELAVKAVLEALLPEGECIRFLGQFEAGERIRKIQELQPHLLVEAFQRLSCCQEEKFAAMKADLMELNTSRKKMKPDLQARIEAVTNEILNLCSMLKSLSDEVARTAEQLGRYEERYQSLIQECERLCHEVQKQ